MGTSGNRGQKRRLQELLKLTTGDLIAFSDQDDIWDTAKIATLLNGLGSNGLAVGRSEIIDHAGTPLGHNIFEAVDVSPQPELRLRSLLQPFVSAHALLVKKEIISEIVFSRHHPFDWLLCLEASFSLGVVYVSEAIVYHRIHGNNQSNAAFTKILAKYAGARFSLPRELLRTGAKDRFMFWSALDYMGHSIVIPVETSRMFRGLAEKCADAWYHWKDRPFQKPTSTLKTALLEGLGPLAGSQEDWAFCSKAINVLTSPRRPIGMDDRMV